MDLSPYQEWAAHFNGEIQEPEVCEHATQLRWKAERGEFECEECGEMVECPELLEALAPDLAKPYDLQVCL